MTTLRRFIEANKSALKTSWTKLTTAVIACVAVRPLATQAQHLRRSSTVVAHACRWIQAAGPLSGQLLAAICTGTHANTTMGPALQAPIVLDDDDLEVEPGAPQGPEVVAANGPQPLQPAAVVNATEVSRGTSAPVTTTPAECAACATLCALQPPAGRMRAAAPMCRAWPHGHGHAWAVRPSKLTPLQRCGPHVHAINTARTRATAAPLLMTRATSS